MSLHRRTNAALIGLLFMAAGLAGCFGDDDSPQEDDTPSPSPTGSPTQEPSPPASPSPTVSPTASPSPTTSPSPSPEPGDNHPPEFNVTANVTNGSAPLEVNFTLDGSDPDGDEVTWRLDAQDDGQDDQTGRFLPARASHTYHEEGEYVARLFVSDGIFEVNQTLNISVGPPEPTLVIEDPEGDDELPYFDVVRVEMLNNTTLLTVRVVFVELQPDSQTFSTMNFDVSLNDEAYSVVNCAGLGWDVFRTSDGEFIGADVEVDQENHTIQAEIPLEEITDAQMPYSVFIQSNYSPDYCGDFNRPRDRAPDEGVQVYDPSPTP